mgnify:CR=1 FL=1
MWSDGGLPPGTYALISVFMCVLLAAALGRAHLRGPGSLRGPRARLHDEAVLVYGSELPAHVRLRPWFADRDLQSLAGRPDLIET